MRESFASRTHCTPHLGVITTYFTPTPDFLHTPYATTTHATNYTLAPTHTHASSPLTQGKG